ncbi:MAG: FMN-binding glutamate synthase family protein [Rhodospirillaceae bacterium]|nr:FMN-binding glutamate synthase family protein [Rhodospirillaceae bacterium]
MADFFDSSSWLFDFFAGAAFLFIFVIGLVFLALVMVFISDVTQRKDAIRRNFPVIGRLRHFFSELGKFFRQYFFAMDREEMPFNRELRNWVYRAAAGADNTVPFGSTRSLQPQGTILFANAAYPDPDLYGADAAPMVIGAGCRRPFAALSFFNISGMSYGAISRPAVSALSRGAALAGCWLNTGEGGLSPWHVDGDCDIVFQIGTAKYGCRTEDGNLNPARLTELAAHDQVRMFEIKLAQGAKPGKGGILPGAKVTEEIAGIRGIPVGQDSISPNRHLDIANDNQLIDTINRVRDLTGKPVGLKTVIGEPRWLDRFFETIVKRGEGCAPDFITVDSADGGTGAAPLPLIDYLGLPIQESLPRVVDKLNEFGLRHRIRVIASGKLITPGPVAWALAAGADFVASARGFMFALGCIQALQCNRNTCPTGITTHQRRLQRGLDPADKAERVWRYHRGVEKEVGIIAHSCGVHDPRMLGRQHCRIVTENGATMPFEKIYPDVPAPVRHDL